PFEGLDWTPVDRALTYVAFGGVFRSGTGSTPSQLWTDDLAVAIDPLASRMELSGPSPVTSGSCVPIVISGSSTFDAGTAQSPFDLGVHVDVIAGNAAVFLDSACQQPGALVNFARGDVQQRVWVKPVSPGFLSMSASGLSLLPGLVLSIGVLDGGSD